MSIDIHLGFIGVIFGWRNIRNDRNKARSPWARAKASWEARGYLQVIFLRKRDARFSSEGKNSLGLRGDLDLRLD
jgi:hypothetical protein